MAAIYRFPYEQTNDYLGTATFRPIEVDPASIGSIDFKRTKRLANSVFSVLGGLGGGPDDQQLEEARGVLDEEDPAENRGPTIRPSSRPAADRRVTLYLPQAIQVSDVADYPEVELGVIGAAAEAALRQGQTVGQALGASATAALSSITDTINGELGERAATLAGVRAVRSLVPNAAVENGVTSAARVTINPNKRTLFAGVGLRQFTFSFKMVATSAKEAQEIDNIIKFFRSEMYPTVIQGAETIGFNFPRPIQIDLKYNGNQVAQKFKPVYIRSVNTTYNPGTMGYHADGKPSEVDLSINFSEERTLSRADVEAGF